MEKSLKLEIVTPDKLVLSEAVDYVGAPGFEGEFGVLPNHIPFLSALQIGNLYYKKDGAAAPPFDGTGATAGAAPIDVGKVTTYTVTGLDDNATYHFALTAYSGSEESGYSAIVTVNPAAASTTAPAPQLLQINVK